ncbi:MAG: dockerin type I repeat-containing protein, partial [Clostridia bacterium]|nr:dockerin type I repeat-containing protein [Clostridia bacterium]
MKTKKSSRIQRVIGLFIILSLVITAFPASVFSAQVKYGDVDQDGKIAAADALVVLQSVVGKVELSGTPKQAGDVDANTKVNAADALMILQFVVGKISVFPAQEVSSMSNEEQFYYQLDQQYKVNYSDFENEIVQLKDSEDAAAIVEALGGDPTSANVAEWGVTADERLSYTPLSNEAKRLGKLSKYNNLPVTKGEIKVGGTTVTYTVPKNATAYDTVPITYTVNSTTGNLPVNFEATAFEDVTRYKNASDIYADCNLPGIVKVDLTYEGYVNGNVGSGAPMLSKDP